MGTRWRSMCARWREQDRVYEGRRGVLVNTGIGLIAWTAWVLLLMWAYR
jgi:hypothetical protein